MKRQVELYPNECSSENNTDAEVLSRWMALDSKFQAEMLRLKLRAMQQYGECADELKHPAAQPA